MDASACVELTQPQSPVSGMEVHRGHNLDNSDDMNAASSPAKKAKVCPTTLNSMREVAEIVLVLSAVSKMRGGKKPTTAENDMMEKAREKMVELCAQISPNDVVSVDVIGGVIEDLGLNKIREQKRGPRPPRMTIAEKMLLTKRKMEESKGFMMQTSKYSSQGSHAVAANTGKTFSVGMLTPFKQNHSSVSSGVVKSALSAQPVPCSKSLPYQTTEDVKMSGIPRKISGIQSGNDQAHVKNMMWSLQPPIYSSSKSGSDNKLNDPTFSFEGNATNSLKVGLHGSLDQTGKTFATTKAVSGALSNKPLQHVNHGYVPSSFNHGEIVKFIHKLWQHRQGERPAWTPPSKDYVNKPLSCQVCKIVSNEVQTVLICDSCEKGFHLQCIQSSIVKGIPRGEWHCLKCLTLSNGKPLPPKYGRVMRNMTLLKGPSNASAVLSSPVKKTMSLEQVMNPHKAAGRSSSLQGILDASTSGSPSVELSASYRDGSSIQGVPDATTSGGNTVEFSSSNRDIAEMKELPSLISNIDDQKDNDKVCYDLKNSSILQSEISGEGLQQGHTIHFEEECQPLGSNSTTIINSEDSQALITSESCAHNIVSDFEVFSKENCVNKPVSDQIIDSITKHDEVIMQKNVVEMSDDVIKSTDKLKCSSDEVLVVDWVGEMVDLIDRKAFFKSCNVNGITYMVHDYAFFSSCNEKLVPCKILAMWEDDIKEKWMNVLMFHFPGDISDAAERPGPPRSNEVYQIKGEHTLLAGKIRGTCRIFGMDKLNEHESDSCYGSGGSDEQHDFFICRWLFDESKGIFGPL